MKSSGLKTVLLTEGGVNKGIGHLIRSNLIYFTEEINENGCIYVNNEKLCQDFIRKTGMKARFYNSLEDIYNFQEIQNDTIDVIIVDLLKPTEKLLANLKKLCSNLIVFDDLRRSFNTDSIFIRPQEVFMSKIHKKGDSIYYEGADYFILNPLLLHYRKTNNFRKNVRRVLVCLGGSTNAKEINTLTQILDQYLSEKIVIDVVSGFSDKINKDNKSKRFRFFNYVDNMAKLIANADIGFISAGFIKFEFMCIGTPFTLVSLNQHQNYLSRKFSSQGYGFYLGQMSTLSKDILTIEKDLNDIMYKFKNRERMYNKMRKLIDGKGLYRFQKLIKSFN